MGANEIGLAAALGVAILVAGGALLALRSSRRAHRRLLDHLPDTAISVFDGDLKIRLSAGASLEAGGRRPAKTKGKSMLSLFPQAQRNAMLAHLQAALRGEKRSFEYHSGVTSRDYWVRMVPLTDAKGEITGGISVALDITARDPGDRDAPVRLAGVDAVTAATRALARSVDPSNARAAVCEGARKVAEAPIAALFEPDRDGVALIPRACVGASLEGLRLPLSGDSGAAAAFNRGEEIFTAIDKGEASGDREFLRRARSRTVLWHPVVRDRSSIGVLAIAWHQQNAGVSLRLSAMIDLLGAEAAVAIGRADLLGQLEHLARTDSLTALPNRRSWEQQLPRELARSWREKQSICVAMIDLDHFKDYNDRRGHQGGDRLLREAAKAWRGALRPYDILARYGGEEFSVILPGCSMSDAIELVERLRRFTPDGESCSAGIAEWDFEEQPEALVGRADAALYRAKRAGRNRAFAAPSAPI